MPDGGDDDGGDDSQDPADDGAGDQQDPPDDGSDGDDSGAESPEEPAAEPETIYGMEVTELEEKSPAAIAGFMVGDIIMAVNGTPTPDFDSLVAALTANRRQAVCDFISVETGEMEQLELTIDRPRVGASVEQVAVQ